MTSMIRLAVALALALLGAACGTAPIKCQPSNCSGCCDEAGECVGTPKQSLQACGAGGAECRVCLPDQLCTTGRCVRNPDAGVTPADGGVGPPPGDGGPGLDAGSGGGCGGQGQLCCSGISCALPLTCQRGFCAAPLAQDGGSCGAASEPCCQGTTCTAADTTCQQGRCVTSHDAGVARKAAGEACQADGECLDGTCLQVGFAGGYCTRGCASATDCLAQSQCGRNPSGVGPATVCLRQCSLPGQAPGGCRSGYVCEANAGTSGVPVCFPGCTSNTTCGAAPTCDSRGFCCGASGFVCCEGSTCAAGNTCSSGTCRAAACGSLGQACCTSGTPCQGQAICLGNQCQACGGDGQPCCANAVCSSGTCQAGTCQAVTQGAVGTPCTDYSQCTGNTCIQETSGLFPGGYCTQDCSSATCPGGASCTPYLASGSLCGAHCVFDGGVGGCRAGYVCERIVPAAPTQGVCASACTSSAQCPGGITCQGGFCCGAPGFKCCAGNACATGTCNLSLGYCQ